ncbi:adhesion G protein-coupled receptor A2-like isoform X2 [Acanthaster planci]|uniref:Adhesion G protein-coupled receptor A2-like isoform X2 n=1 Tax=Acanthaster planci TaxID=133434 RepID=A0A8B7ZL88_ACAPL|nr:adhesion G protein-coupled receptor A2-like isoform X2 [Acanthaster planci]
MGPTIATSFSTSRDGTIDSTGLTPRRRASWREVILSAFTVDKNKTFLMDVLFWHTRQPDGGRHENCVQMLTVYHQDEWNDRPCSQRMNYICKRAVCPNGWRNNGAMCYNFVAFGPLNWTLSEAACKREGAHLVSIHSQQEQNFIYLNLGQYSSGYEWWLGLNDIDEEGTYVWSDGTLTNVLFWDQHEPSGGIEDCVHMSRLLHQNTWNDRPCHQGMRYICKKAIDNEAPVIICPASLILETDPGQSFASVPLLDVISATDNFGIFSVTIEVDSVPLRNADAILSLKTSSYSIRYTVSDATYNSAMCETNIIVVDKTAPTFLVGCPSNINHFINTSLVSTPVSWPTLNASDPSQPLLWNSSHQPNDLFPVGNATLVTYTVTDQYGNYVSCNFTVTVTGVGLDCPENVTTVAQPGSTSTNVSLETPTIFFRGSRKDVLYSFADDNPLGNETGEGIVHVHSEYLARDVFHVGETSVSYCIQETGVQCQFYVSVIGRCASTTTADGLSWPETLEGFIAESIERCPVTTTNVGLPLAVRNCSVIEPPVYLQWGEPEPRDCGDAVSVHDIAKVNISGSNVAEVAKYLSNQSSATPFSAEGLYVISQVLMKIAETGSGDVEVTEAVLETVNNIILKADTSTVSNASSSTSSIVQSVQTQVSLTLQQEGHVSIRQDTVNVEAVSLDPEKASGGFSFVSVRRPGQVETPQDESLVGAEVETFFNTNEIPTDIDVVASVFLPGNIANSTKPTVGNTSQLQASFLIYADDTLFQSASIRKYREQNNSTRKVAGSVVSLTVENVELDNLIEPLVIKFRTPISSASAELDIKSTRCVSWDFGLEDGVGDWSTAGCTLAVSTSERISCHCSHATNFAILVNVKGQLWDASIRRTLDIISQVGCVLSIIALVITLTTYLSIRKLRNGKSRQIFIHFCFSLLMLYIVFLAGVDNAKGSGGGCVFVAALLHYLTLSTMMWMAVEARNMYISTVKVFPEDRPWYILKACVIAWGSPLIVLTITLATATNHYGAMHYCFLRPGLVLYIGLLTPIGLILIHNIVTFVLVMRSLLTVKEASGSQQISKRLQNAAGISVLLGLTWCFGFLAINEAVFAFQLIFCLANSFQGVAVFIMFCVRREEVRTGIAPYMKRLCCGRDCSMPELHPSRSYDVALVLSSASESSTSNTPGTKIDTSVSETQEGVAFFRYIQEV